MLRGGLRCDGCTGSRRWRRSDDAGGHNHATGRRQIDVGLENRSAISPRYCQHAVRRHAVSSLPIKQDVEQPRSVAASWANTTVTKGLMGATLHSDASKAHPQRADHFRSQLGRPRREVADRARVVEALASEGACSTYVHTLARSNSASNRDLEDKDGRSTAPEGSATRPTPVHRGSLLLPCPKAGRLGSPFGLLGG